MTTSTVNSGSLIAHINSSGNILCNNIDANNKSYITTLQTNTTNMSYTTGKTNFNEILEASYIKATENASLINQNLINASLPLGSYINWNSSVNNGECNFITSKSAGTGGFTFHNVSSNTVNSAVLLSKISSTGNIICNNVTTTNTSDISTFKTNTTNITYNCATGITNLNAKFSE